VPAQILERRVAGGSDDAEERISNGAVNLGSSDLELVTDGGTVQMVGLRFAGVTIPRNATILRAWVQFTTDATTATGPTTVQLFGEAADDAAGFTTGGFDVSRRARTSTSVTWGPIPAWDAPGAAGTEQRTPDLSAILQEIVRRPGWSSGNAIGIVVTGSGRRVAVSYDGSAGASPLLHVEY
jgi:hypothetical protein